MGQGVIVPGPDLSNLFTKVRNGVFWQTLPQKMPHGIHECGYAFSVCRCFERRKTIQAKPLTCIQKSS
jgi:hypothetical protein